MRKPRSVAKANLQPGELYLSKSRIKMLSRCPAQYEWRYVKGIVLPPSGALFTGSTVHYVAAFDYEYKLDAGQTRPLDEVLDFFSDSWDKREAIIDEDGEDQVGDVDWGGENKDVLKQTGLDVTRVYHDQGVVNTNPVVVETSFERGLSIPLPHDQFGLVRIETILDLIDDDANIIDLKVVGRSKSNADIEGDIEPDLYAPAMGSEIDMRYHFLVKTKIPKYEPVSTTRSRDCIAWVQNDLLPPLYRMVTAGVFPKNTEGWLCSPSYCGYYSLCRPTSKVMPKGFGI